MDFIILIIIAITVLLILATVLKVNLNKVKHIAMDERLNELTKKYPENIEICKEMLRMLNNEKVKIEEDKEATTSLYIAVSNKIFIANTKESFTRIQTMAHECLHSIQDRRILMFNFIFSNIYIIYFAIAIILTILNIMGNSMLLLSIFLILSLTYYMVRAFLETDAMTKAKYLAKEYMEKIGVSPNEEIQEITKGFEILNDTGIKLVNYNLFAEILIKVIIFSIVALIF